MGSLGSRKTRRNSGRTLEKALSHQKVGWIETEWGEISRSEDHWEYRIVFVLIVG
jgi:hypothetical protein